jgi:hypothetical protein
MKTFLLILELIGGLILLFGLGYMTGHLLKLDKYFKDKYYDNISHNQNAIN